MPYFFIISGRAARMPPPPGARRPQPVDAGTAPRRCHGRRTAPGSGRKAATPRRNQCMPRAAARQASAACRNCCRRGLLRRGPQASSAHSARRARGAPPPRPHLPAPGRRQPPAFPIPAAGQATVPAGTRRARGMRARVPRPLHSRPGAEGAAGMLAMRAGRRLGAGRNRQCVVQETRASGSRCRPTADGPGTAAARSPPAGAAPWRSQLPAPQSGRPQGI